jgi:hypothetical protein
LGLEKMVVREVVRLEELKWPEATRLVWALVVWAIMVGLARFQMVAGVAVEPERLVLMERVLPAGMVALV